MAGENLEIPRSIQLQMAQAEQQRMIEHAMATWMASMQLVKGHVYDLWEPGTRQTNITLLDVVITVSPMGLVPQALIVSDEAGRKIRIPWHAVVKIVERPTANARKNRPST